jgi:L-xylulokinase
VLDLAVGTEVLPDVVPSWQTCGRVTSDATTETGLAAGTPVASGLHDVGATALGTGAHRPGQGVLIVGTWGQSIVVTDDPYADEGDGGSTVDGTDGDERDGDERDGDLPDSPGLTRRYLDGYLRYKGLRSAATCLDWFVAEFGDEWRRRADAEAVSPYEIYDRVVADVPAGAAGLLFHPYLDGSTDAPTDRGGFYGLTSEHTKATMLRAVYEGVAISQAARLAELAPATRLTDVRLSGGGARSEVWSDIFAAAVDDPLLVPAGEEAGARGVAICGALAAGVYPDHDRAVDRMVAVERRHDPDADTATLYRDRRETFEGALEAIRPTWKRLMVDPESDSIDD